MIVRIDYPQPGVRLDLWGGTSGVFAGLDQFNRVIDQRWQNSITGTPTDIDRYQYGYDLNSNRQYKANVVGTPIVTGGLDEFYTYDHLNRLTDMQRGTLNGTNTGITGTPSREMDWMLDPTGNWPGYLTKTAGTTDLLQSRTSNTVNEITAVSESTGPTWVTPAYDEAGNTTTMPQVSDPTQSFTAVYDAWNRMVSISASGSLVAQYQYDGRNRRNYKITYSGGVPVEGRIFYFTDNWQDIEERVGASTAMDKQYVWGVRYIDELVCRDDTMPQRLYAAQDANFNLTAITNTSGAVEERYVFDPYGTRTIMSASWSVISSSSHAWVIGHQGLMLDLESGLFYNRARMLHSMLGSFDRRDPFYYRSQLNLYDYVNGRPANRLDPTGMICCPPAKLAQESNDLAKCFAAVDAQMGKDLANALTAYNTSMASVNAVTASLLARCATSVSPKNLFYTEIVWGCQKGVQTAQGGVALGVFTAYETARAAILIANEKARNDCMHMYPCGVLNLGNPPSIP